MGCQKGGQGNPLQDPNDHEKQANTVKEVHRASLLSKIEKTLISCTGWIVWERNIKAGVAKVIYFRF